MERPAQQAVLGHKIGNADRCAKGVAVIIIKAEFSWLRVRERSETGVVLKQVSPGEISGESTSDVSR